MKVSRRFLMIVGAVLVLAAGGIGAFLMLRSTDSADLSVAPAPGENAAAALEGGPDALLYLGGTTLQRNLIKAQETETVMDLGSTNVVAAPGSKWLAYVVSGPTDEVIGSGVQPVLHVFDPTTKDDVEVGPGYQPSWNPLGTRLAYLRTTDATNCSPLSCSSPSRITLYDPATGDSLPISDPEIWELGTTWSGDRVLAAKFHDADRVFTFDASGDEVVMDVPPNEVWGASPDGSWVVRVRPSMSEFLPVEEGKVSGRAVPIDLQGASFGSGRWAPDSSSIAAVVTQPSGADPTIIQRKLATLLGLSLERVDELLHQPLEQLAEYYEKLVKEDPAKARQARALAERYRAITSAPDSSLALLSPDDPSPTPVEGSIGVQGAPLWAPDGDSLVFARLVDPAAGLLQAFSCELDISGSCRLLFSWTEGVVLLRAE